MANKYSSPYDGPDHFQESQDRLEIQEQVDTNEQSDSQDQLLLSNGPASKVTGKREFLKSIVLSVSKRLTIQATRNISVERERESKSAESTLTSPIWNTPKKWEYDRYDGHVPGSVDELHMHLDAGRHPEILELSIKAKQRLIPETQHGTWEYKILNAMLIHIRRRRENHELDAIQSQTLEQLGRPHEHTRFE